MLYLGVSPVDVVVGCHGLGLGRQRSVAKAAAAVTSVATGAWHQEVAALDRRRCIASGRIAASTSPPPLEMEHFLRLSAMPDLTADRALHPGCWSLDPGVPVAHRIRRAAASVLAAGGALRQALLVEDCLRRPRPRPTPRPRQPAEHHVSSPRGLGLGRRWSASLGRLGVDLVRPQSV